MKRQSYKESQDKGCVGLPNCPNAIGLSVWLYFGILFELLNVENMKLMQWWNILEYTLGNISITMMIKTTKL